MLAKVARDRIMTELAPGFADFGWGHNKGYAAPEHLDALRRLGPSEHHRRSWRITGNVVGPQEGCEHGGASTPEGRSVAREHLIEEGSAS